MPIYRGCLVIFCLRIPLKARVVVRRFVKPRSGTQTSLQVSETCPYRVSERPHEILMLVTKTLNEVLRSRL